MDKDPPLMDQRLVIIERDNAYWVTWEGDSDDWLVIFSNTEGFPARQWAERLVDLYNQGITSEVSSEES
jgi:hypothetical protein